MSKCTTIPYRAQKTLNRLGVTMSNFPDRHLSRQRGKEKEHILLTFLNQEIYSTAINFGLLLKQDKTIISKLLSRLVKKQLIEKHIMELDTGNITVWGITQLGIQSLAYSDDSPIIPFQASRISLVTLNHTLMTQRAYIALKHLEWTNWINADRQVFKNKYPVSHRPDAIILPKNTTQWVAIEVELTIKTPLRYRSILKSHIGAIEKGYWGHVIYVVPNDSSKKILQNRFNNIHYIQFDEARRPFEKLRHFFSIFTQEELKTLRQAT